MPRCSALLSAVATAPIEVSLRQPSAMLPGKQETTVIPGSAVTKETDESIVGDVLAQCRHDEDARP